MAKGVAGAAKQMRPAAAGLSGMRMYLGVVCPRSALWPTVQLQ